MPATDCPPTTSPQSVSAAPKTDPSESSASPATPAKATAYNAAPTPADPQGETPSQGHTPTLDEDGRWCAYRKTRTTAQEGGLRAAAEKPSDSELAGASPAVVTVSTCGFGGVATGGLRVTGAEDPAGPAVVDDRKSPLEGAVAVPAGHAMGRNRGRNGGVAGHLRVEIARRRGRCVDCAGGSARRRRPRSHAAVDGCSWLGGGFVSIRRRARKVAANPAATAVATTAGLPAEFLDPDDPHWHDDDRDLARFRDVSRPLLPEVAAAACRLARWKRLIAAAERFAVEQGWIQMCPGSGLQLPDHRRMAAEGVPLMQWRKERLRLVGASMKT